MAYDDKVDLQPGYYYVSVIDGPRWSFLLGPFPNNHAAALRMVNKVKKKAAEVDPRAHFYAFGTARLPLECSPRKGVLNDLFAGEV